MSLICIAAIKESSLHLKIWPFAETGYWRKPYFTQGTFAETPLAKEVGHNLPIKFINYI